ncbi:4'-phosphopantetheinyl transferase [Candidatus Burkholderia pumila]|uniref:4'-phosphopantetheinyl transferase n=1 Tax=Candidatus Burkholderia pumila TaxID=1090375 RepID=A0ABR5HKT9_9BURK|nr:4'-phosphopantetheinyl transferase [Candidatus Burkholderia pumila]
MQLLSLSLPFDAPEDVRVWLIEIALAASLEAADAGVLNDSELARPPFSSQCGCRAFCDGSSGFAPDIRYGTWMKMKTRQVLSSSGRPALAATRNAPDFNVSHSGVYGAIAVSTQGSVGIDIEEARSSLDWRKLGSTVFADADRRAIDALPDSAQHTTFFDCWTAKEAVLKAHGTGMSRVP